MRRLWLVAAVVLAVVVAIQVTSSRAADRFAAVADAPTVAAGSDVLAGIPEIPARIRGNDYRRVAFGDAWTDDNSAPGGHNECDTRFLGGFGVLRGTLQEAEFTSGTLQ